MAAANERTIIPAPASSSGVSPILSNTSAFLNLINGTSQTTSSTGETKTSETDVSPEGITELMRQMMEGTGGLADLATGAHVAGLYNDTTKTLLAQNLMAKIAGQAALASAKTTTTTTPSSTTTKQQAPLNASSIGKSLLTAGIASVGSKLAKKTGILKAIGLDDDTPAKAVASASGSASIGGGETAGAGGANVDDMIRIGGGDPLGDSVNAEASALGGATADDSAGWLSFSDDSSDLGSAAQDISGAQVVGEDAPNLALDVSSGTDVASDAGSSIIDNTVDSVDSGDASGFFSDLFDGFKRGGVVGKKPAQNSSTRMGYATGGLVNVDQGKPTPITPATPVDDPVSRVTSLPATPSPASGGAKKAGTNEDAGDASSGPGTASTGSGATPSLSTLGTAALAVMGFAANPVFGSINALSNLTTGKGALSNLVSGIASAFAGPEQTGNGVADFEGGENATPGTDPLGAVDFSSVPGYGGIPGFTGSGTVAASLPGNVGAAPPGFADSDAVPGDFGPGAPGGVGFGSDEAGFSGDDSSSNGTESGTESGTDSGTGDASGGDTGSGDSGSGDSGDGGGDGYADGGVINAPGDGTEDTRMIKAADGEFVINAQAAKALGYDRLNWLNTILGGKAS